MTNKIIKSLNIEMTERDMRYILHALRELMVKLEKEIEKDPDGEEDITPMYADDVLSIRDIDNRLKEIAVPVFADTVLSVSYDTL